MVIQVLKWSESAVEKVSVKGVLRDRDRELKSRLKGSSGFEVIGIWIVEPMGTTFQ